MKTVATSKLAGVLVIAAACNNITGVGDIILDPDFDPSNGATTGSGKNPGPTAGAGASTGKVTASAGAGAGGPTGPSSGNGSGPGATSVATTGPTTAATTSGAGGASTSTSVSTSASTAASSGAGGMVAWPAGPYGVAQGKTIPENMSFSGYPEGSSQPGTIAMKSWYDPDGSKGIHGILVTTSQFGCGPCAQEAQSMETKISGWKQKGWNIKVLTLILNDQYGGSAKTSSAGAWKQKFGLTNVAVGADPPFTMAGGYGYGTPLEVTIDPRTMKVADVDEGYTGSFPTLESIAAKNAK
jgi:hypothetical protein